MSFAGFPAEGLSVLAGLAEDNSKAYLEANRPAYEALVGAAKVFAADLGERLGRQGSVSRLARDTRFSKDKRPYRTDLFTIFWNGEGRSWDNPALVVQLAPETVLLGGGRHHFDRDELAAYRRALDDEDAGRSLEAALAAAGEVELGGTLKRGPAGSAADHPRAALLRHTGMIVWRTLPLPPRSGRGGLRRLVRGAPRAVRPGRAVAGAAHFRAWSTARAPRQPLTRPRSPASTTRASRTGWRRSRRGCGSQPTWRAG